MTMRPLASSSRIDWSERITGRRLATVSAAFDGVDLFGERAGFAEFDAGGHLDVQFVLAVDREVTVLEDEAEHVPAVHAVVAQEMEVVTGHLDTRAAVGEPEADDGAHRLRDRPLGLVRDHFCEWRV